MELVMWYLFDHVKVMVMRLRKVAVFLNQKQYECRYTILKVYGNYT